MTTYERESDSPSRHSDPKSFLRGRNPAASSPTWLHDAVPDSAFYWPDGTTLYDRLELCYSRARRAGQIAPRAEHLLAEPRMLSALLSRLAVADPVVFHVCLVHYTLVLAPIVENDPDNTQTALREIRAALESMDTFGAALMSECSHRSSSHLHLRTRATFDRATGDFVLDTPDRDARKFPNNTASPGISKTGAVYAQLVVDGIERGMFAFIVPLRDATGAVLPGVDIEPAPDTVALASDYAYVRFHELRLPRHAWLSAGASLEDDGTFHDPLPDTDARRAGTMSAGAPHVWRSIIAAAASIAQGAARILYSHTADRLSMGRLAPEQPLLRYRTVREAVLGNLAAAYVLAIVSEHAHGERPTATTAGASTWAPWSAVDHELPLLKAAATRLCAEVVTSCRAHCGANGFAGHNRLNAFHGWAHVYGTAGGDNDLILMDTAHALCDAADDLPIADRNGAVRTDLTAPRNWLSMAQAVERAYRRKLSVEVEAARAGGSDHFTAWNDNLPLAQAAAAAYSDRIVLQASAAAHDAALEPVGGLLRLHALSWIEKHAGILGELDLVPRPLADHIWDQRRALCDSLMPHAADLAAAFDLPDLAR
ncbi:acyl-CoA dehydrogenase [Nocardia sp. N2S4-5]|uniref:acyl-CoA dehydrogenase family protein n=1 Tax=Nocardia sp. N2S4-5 TaxID=3351565 RepID=UPI0037D436F0